MFRLIVLLSVGVSAGDNTPLVVVTWGFTQAALTSWNALSEGQSALDVVTLGCSVCEELQCDGTVGFGGSPDENGETTLDSLIFDGTTFNMGAVGGLRRVKQAAAVARHVFHYTNHSILVGSLATEFALKMGFREQSLDTPQSTNEWLKWKTDSCQPNFWTAVTPDPKSSCGPYTPLENTYHHDTISMAVIDRNNHIAAGTSSNGAKFKIPGRMGDAALPGAGAYADSSVGAGLATGDGDVMMRFLPTFLMVELMRTGLSPQAAATTAISRIIRFYPKFSGALIAVNKRGQVAATCHNLPSGKFPYMVMSKSRRSASPLTVPCIDTPQSTRTVTN